MRVGVVGAGFVGLTAALRLAKNGVKVEVFEANGSVGGLASGFSHPGWNWPLERFYHHIFANDYEISNLGREVSCPPIFFRPKTSIYFDREIHAFDSPLDLLQFPHLTFINKIRMGATIAFLKLAPFWKPLERLSAQEFLYTSMGKSAYEAIWEPLLKAKFGSFASQVNAAWFWARIKKRTARLGYFKRGFQGLADCVDESIRDLGGKIHLDSPVSSIRKEGGSFKITLKNRSEKFDRVIVTAASPIFTQMVPELPSSYQKKLKNLKMLDALVIILITKKPVLPGIYWLNITDQELPFLVVVEHTNMIDKKYYGGQHIVYLGAYLPKTHKNLKLTDAQVLKKAIEQLEQISSDISRELVTDYFVFRGRDVQPVVPRNYSLDVPSIETPIRHLYLGNMSLVYPWDRGTNYAVELGNKIAKRILKK